LEYFDGEISSRIYPINRGQDKIILLNKLKELSIMQRDKHRNTGMKFNMGRLALLILVVAFGLLIYLVYDLRRTEKSLAESLIQKTMENARLELGRYFSEAERTLSVVSEQAMLGELDDLTRDGMNNYFSPLLRYNRHIKYVALVTRGTYESVLYWDDENKLSSRETWLEEWGPVGFYKNWVPGNDPGTWEMENKFEKNEAVDIKTQLWYSEPLKREAGYLYWSGPVRFESTRELGMVLTTKWIQPKDPQDNILGLAILLTQLSDYTRNLELSEGGNVFIISEDGRFIGLPRHAPFASGGDMESHLFTHVDSTEFNLPGLVWNYWKTRHEEKESSFKMDSESGEQWASLIKFHLSEDKYITIGVTVPEADIFTELNRTKRIIIGSFIFILVLTSFLLFSYNQTKKANRILDTKNIEINSQKIIIEERNKDILDSISYARGLQTAMFPTREMMNESLKDYFVFFRPKDMVAGDFYWMESLEDTLFLAAADCTGHGVPGAMVSVVCIHALNRAVKEYGLTDPGLILDRTREMVIEDFQKSKRSVSDGMDIALITLNGHELHYAGAYNSLWQIRDGELIETKADKQPVGNYENAKAFTTHQIDCHPGDSFYIFSDGFADQFGGENNKKLKTKSFKMLLLEIHEKSMEEQGEVLDHFFEDWKKNLEQIDDVCVIGFRI
jgi:serine phosphatase RsbU (regulator of sigma subunit)